MDGYFTFSRKNYSTGFDKMVSTYLEIQNNTEQFFFLTSTTMEVTRLKLQQFVRQ